MMPQTPLTLPETFMPESGNGHDIGLPTMMISIPTAEEIIKMVDQHETDIQPLRDRMESDYKRYRLTEHVNTDPVSGEALQGYAVYTSSEARAFANKIISWLANAEIPIRVPHYNDRTHAPEADNLKERLAAGFLRSADERLTAALQPKLQSQESFYIPIRGGYPGGRCLLAKRPDGSTYVDITPWDPLHTHWGIGPNGLTWACYKIKKTRQQILDEYGVSIDSEEHQQPGSTDAEKEGFDVYDWYNGYINTVLTATQRLKPPTFHGSPRTPVFMVLVGNTPLTQSSVISDVIKDVGESVFESVRNLYDKYDDMMSIMLELTARARDQGLKIFSKTGAKTLPHDPRLRGTNVSLKTDEEDIKPIELMEMARETGAFMGLLSGQIQRATLPYSAYGQLEFQLSGFAIGQLRQGIESVLTTRLEAMKAVYLQIVNLLYDQYMTNFFDPMQLSGQDRGRKYFSQTIQPETLSNTCDYTVDIWSQLPQDEMTKWSIAQIARTGPTPLMADAWLRDNVLGIQDSEQAENQIKAEQAERVLPEATLFSLMKAAEDQGQPEIAKMYYQKLLMFIAQAMGVQPQGAGGPMPETNRGGGPPPMGQRPEVQPNAATGAVPTAEQNAGGNLGPTYQAPGTPRPGLGT